MSDSDMGPRPSLSDVRQKSFSAACRYRRAGMRLASFVCLDLIKESNCLAAAKMTMLKRRAQL